MCHSCTVLESMCRLSVAVRHDAPREMLQSTTVLTRRKMGTTVPSILARKKRKIHCSTSCHCIP